MLTTLLVPLGALIYLRLNRFHQFLLLSLSALLPLTFGDFRSIPEFLFIEWLPFITLLILIHDLVPINSIVKRTNLFRFRGVEIFIFAILILMIWTSVSFVENEILYKSLHHVEKTGTIRTYFSILNNILLFFITIIFITAYFEQIDFEIFFKFLIYISILLGAVRIFSHFFEFNIPFLGGEFDYGGEYGKYAKLKYGGTAFRLGGLNDIVSIGVPATFSYYIYKKKMNYFVLILLLSYLFLSGGRTIAIGVIIPIIVFSFIFFPKNFLYLIVGVGVFLILAVILLPDDFLKGQTGRMTTLKEGFMGLDVARTLSWKYYYDIFLDNPLWGKGIGDYRRFIFFPKTDIEYFVKAQLVAGGHGSYISLLSTLGLGGFLYFTIMLFGGIILSYQKINQYLNDNLNKTAIAVFTFMLLLIKMFDYITAKNGLTIPILFYVVGFIVSLTVLQNKENLQNSQK